MLSAVRREEREKGQNKINFNFKAGICWLSHSVLKLIKIYQLG
jgi:hypothetical protein